MEHQLMHRLFSYLTYPSSSKVGPCILASWGFSYVGEEESVKCVLCKTVLKHIQSLIDLKQKHKLASPRCDVFNQLRTVVRESVQDFQGKFKYCSTVWPR